MFLSKIFNKEGATPLYAPMTGKVVRMEEVPDPAFAEKMMGEGCAIVLADGKIVAPIDGEINVAFATGHAYGLIDKDGVEILIHIGIDTVEMEGEGFTTYVKIGDKVKKGDLLAEVDLDKMKEYGKSLISPIAIIDKEKVTLHCIGENVVAGETLLLEY